VNAADRYEVGNHFTGSLSAVSGARDVRSNYFTVCVCVRVCVVCVCCVCVCVCALCCAVETCVASEDDVLMASGPGKNMALYEVCVILVHCIS